MKGRGITLWRQQCYTIASNVSPPLNESHARTGRSGHLKQALIAHRHFFAFGRRRRSIVMVMQLQGTPDLRDADIGICRPRSHD